MMLNFCIHSVFRQYGWQFFYRVAALHPLRTARAFLQAERLDTSGNTIRLSGSCTPGANSIVGVGFCLKPMDPPCPAGRANHNCIYFEHPPLRDPSPCRNCVIRKLGALTLKTGSAFYIMTSAQDILQDVFAPSLHQKRFTSGLFVLCGYSLQPFAVGMLASGIRGCMFQFHRGGCGDYRTFIMADRGIKNEQAEISDSTLVEFSEAIKNGSNESGTAVRFKKRGNIYVAE